MSEVLRQRVIKPSTAPQANNPEIGHLRAMLLAAMVTIAPQLSCSGTVEETTHQEDPAGTAENALGKGVINCEVLEGVREWVVSGNSTENFVLNVSEEDRPVFEKLVPAGAFNFQEPIQSETAKRINLQAFADTGEKINIVLDPAADEMQGEKYCLDYKYQGGNGH